MKKSRRDKWKIELDVLCLLLWSDPKAWLVVLLRGQWSAPPSLSKPSFITSLISKVRVSQLKPGSVALGAWGEALCFFPFVVNVNHPFETRSWCCPSVALGSFVGNAADTEHQSLWWEEPFPGAPRFAVCQLHPSCSSCFYPAAVGFNSSATFGWWGNSHVFSFPFPWAPIPSGFGTAISSDIRSCGCWVWLSLQPPDGGVSRAKGISYAQQEDVTLVPELRVADSSSNQGVWWVLEGSTTRGAPAQVFCHSHQGSPSGLKF